MIASPKLIFDECVPRGAVATLVREIDEDQIWDHVTSKYAQGALDEEWIPELATEGDWIVISADRGTHPKRNERKLPDLCIECSVTHVLLSATIHNFTTDEKIACMRDLWDDILETSEAEPGSRYVMRLNGQGGIPVLEKRVIRRRKPPRP